jgi:peptidyl-prolyl cis-trans isomerase D
MIRFLQTPGPLKKIILGGLLLLICGAMVVTLVPGGISSTLGLGGPGQGIVAKVAGEDVTTQDVDRQARLMLQQQFPRGGAQTSALLPYFASRAADNLINQKAILVEARRLGLRVTDEEVRDELRKNPNFSQAFFPGGNFIGQENYESILQQHDMTVPVFEQSVKDEILFGKLRDLVAGSASVSESDIRRDFARQNSKVKFDYAVLSKEDLLKGIHPADAELQAYYDSHKANYNNAIPEKRKVRYVVIDNAKIGAATTVTPQELEDYYHQHRDEFMVAEQVNVRHILIKTPPAGADGKVDAKATDASRQKAEDLLKQLKAGGNFADLAKKNSEDTSTAKNGGSLGWVGKGRTDPEFEKAAFSLPKGGMSGVVQSSFGFHIIQVDDKQDAHLKPLAEVKDQIEPIIKQQKSSQAANAQATALLAQARSNGLEKAAAAKDLQVVSTDFVSHEDSLPGIGSSPQFMAALFGEADKSPPDVVQLPEGYAVFQLVEIKPPATPTFAEIRSRVETDFKNERVEALLTQKTQELSDRTKADHDLKKAAKELGATVKTSDFVAPDGQVPDVGAMSGPASVAFTLNPGDTSGPISAGANGIVLTVLEKQEPSEQDFVAKKDSIRDSLRQTKQAELFELFVENLRQQMEKTGKIKINPDEMKNLTRPTGGESGA